MAGKKNGAPSFDERCSWGAGSVVFTDRNGKPVDVSKLNTPAKKTAGTKTTPKKK